MERTAILRMIRVFVSLFVYQRLTGFPSSKFNRLFTIIYAEHSSWMLARCGMNYAAG